MSKDDLRLAIRSLPFPERVELLEELWREAESERSGLLKWQNELLDQRLKDAEVHPKDWVSWDEAKQRLERMALTDWLRRHGKERRSAEIAAFAAENAGTNLDLDRDLEEAGIEVIEAAVETELEARFKDLIEQLAARALAEGITDADIDREVQVVRNAARPV